MGRKQKADVVGYATPDDVEAAIRDLSEADLHRLEGFAKFRAGSLRALGLGVSSDDLLQEAFTRTFEQRRKWKPGITFVKHLIETMRSISNHAPDELKDHRPVEIKDEGGENDGTGVVLAENGARPDDILGAVDVLHAIRGHFAEDGEVCDLIDGVSEEMKGPEMQEALGWSQRKYETVMRRLRRSVRDVEEWQP